MAMINESQYMTEIPETFRPVASLADPNPLTLFLRFLRRFLG